MMFFGGTADNGYARLLGPLIEDEAACRRITLLEGPPFARELADIKDSFRTVSFDNVFRDQKLVKRRVSFQLSRPGTPSADYAAAAASAPTAPSAPSVTPQGPAAPKNSMATEAPQNAVTADVLRNSQGQRVDSPLSYSMQEFVNLKNRRLCNSYHILGRCPFLEFHGNCQHDHKVKLNDRQKAALRAVARQSPCQAGLYCSDMDCLAGHRCTRINCPRTNCRFPLAMHNVDTKVVK